MSRPGHTTHGRWRLKSAPPSLFAILSERIDFLAAGSGTRAVPASESGTVQEGASQFFRIVVLPLPLKWQEAANYQRKAASGNRHSGRSLLMPNGTLNP